jgi:hypothetical protein
MTLTQLVGINIGERTTIVRVPMPQFRHPGGVNAVKGELRFRGFLV